MRKRDWSTLKYLLKQALFRVSNQMHDNESEVGKVWRSNYLNVSSYFKYLFQLNAVKSEDYVPYKPASTLFNTDVKLIAFYLPQFHPIAENDEWWGKGFTEWTNVAKAIPQFFGHYQPRLPGDLGFYDLRLIDNQQKQAELAKQYGVHGFCFYFYWFAGKILLETPVRNFEENINFPFCLCWANENWTRRWDGHESDVLIAQNHSPEDDIAFINYISRYLRNKNYITIDGKVLLIVYRPKLFPDPKATAMRWRNWCRENGIGEIYLVCTHSFDREDPRVIGFDAAMEFPPNTFPISAINKQFVMANPKYRGVVYNYNELIKCADAYVKPEYKKFRGICPSWDNEARNPGGGKTLVGSSPKLFRSWLKKLIFFTCDNFKPLERVIFINAWNEWAEGAYLEPDRKYGYAYLQAITDALTSYKSTLKQRRKIIYVCHDAHFHGAQLLSLHIIKMLCCNLKYDVHCMLKSGGGLEPEFNKYSTVYNLEKRYNNDKAIDELITCLYKQGVNEAICNTVVSGDLAKILHEHNIKVITLVHEMPETIRSMKLEMHAKILSEYSFKVVFPSAFVKDKFQSVVNINENKTIIMPQGLFNRKCSNKKEAYVQLRNDFSLPKEARIVLGVGYGYHRKGIDIFFEIVKRISGIDKNIYFIWVGALCPEIQVVADLLIKQYSNILLVSPREEIDMFYAGADIFLLPSREDPFPSVVIEAMSVGTPVIAFENAGGFVDVVNEETGILVPYEDVSSMTKAIISLLIDDKKRETLGSNAEALIESKFNFTDYVYNLLHLIGHDYKKISVVIPNYNYGRYLPLRLSSILRQTFPIYEIIFLDDDSLDDSLVVASTYLKDFLNVKIIKNDKNSGSVFKQWLKGLNIARGEYIWIAEADDLCEETFLAKLMNAFTKDPEIVLAYSQSQQIDEYGEIIAENYFEYLNDISAVKWEKDYIRDGMEEIADTLAIKNTIVNISSALFKKQDQSFFEPILDWKIAGDWMFYILLLRHGKVAYVADSLNQHRRHNKSVASSGKNKLNHYNEIIGIYNYIDTNFCISEETKQKRDIYLKYLKKTFL